MKKILLVLVLLLTLGGCATYKMVPDGYTGPTVPIDDSANNENSTKGRLFYVAAINGIEISNARSATGRASYGQGFRLTAVGAYRSVKVEPMKLRLVGTHVTAAPIHEIASRATGNFFTVEGDVDFLPIAGRKYVVTGELTKEVASVWIADAETGAPVTAKITAK